MEFPSPTFVNQHVALVRPKQSIIHPRFLAFVLHSAVGSAQFKISEYGGTKQGLGLGDVKGVFIPVPPMPEQIDLCCKIDTEVGKLAEAIGRLEREIELFREYRTRLTADVVAGKLDVREAASRLPDEAPPLPDVLGEPNAVDELEPAEEELAA